MLHLEKKPRLGTPEPAPTPCTTLTPITGALPALHTLLIRVAFASDAFDVLGWQKVTVFTKNDLKSNFMACKAVVEDGELWYEQHGLWPIVCGLDRRLLWTWTTLRPLAIDANAQ